MVFRADTYSVLLVSASDAFFRTVAPLLPASDYGPVIQVSNLREAGRHNADLVIVNSPLPDGDGLDTCVRLCSETDSGVMLLVPQDRLETVRETAMTAGVLTLGKPLSSALFSQGLCSLCAMHERLRAREQVQQRVEETIEELRLINRAKWLLITCLNMTEDEAHRYIGKLAMQQQCSKREIADNIIRIYAQ